MTQWSNEFLSLIRQHVDAYTVELHQSISANFLPEYPGIWIQSKNHRRLFMLRTGGLRDRPSHLTYQGCSTALNYLQNFKNFARIKSRTLGKQPVFGISNAFAIPFITPHCNFGLTDSATWKIGDLKEKTSGCRNANWRKMFWGHIHNCDELKYWLLMLIWISALIYMCLWIKKF